MTLPNSTLEATIADFREKKLGTLIYMSKTGSHLHGSACDTSDIDIKGLFLPDIEKLMTREHEDHIKYQFTENGKVTEVTFISVQEFLDKLMKMECNTVELLFSMDSNQILLAGPLSKYLREQAGKLLTRNVSSFTGMANAEVKRYKNHTQRNCHKDIAHGIRSGIQARELLDTGKLVFPIPQINVIRKVKFGQIKLDDAYSLMELQFHVLENPREEPTPEQFYLKRKLIIDMYQFTA